MAPKYFVDLVVWKKATTIAERVRRAAQLLSDNDDPWLMHEIRRAVLASSSAIAQGYGRSPRAYRKSLSVARGKVARASALCHMAELTEESLRDTLAPIRAEMDELYRMVARLRARSTEQDN